MNTADPLAEYEAAEDAIKSGWGSEKTKIDAVLALARGGATQLAMSRFDEFGLGNLIKNEDALALKGRLLKDFAESLNGVNRIDYLTQSAIAYQRAWEITKGTYSGINAATLHALSGRMHESQTIAKTVLESLRQKRHAGNPEESYYRLATAAEAHLLLGDTQKAERVLENAIAVDSENHVAHASTLKQLSKILRSSGEDSTWLDRFRPPPCCFYAGRMRGMGGNSERSSRLKELVTQWMDNNEISVAYGALAAGADLIFAEIYLARGGKLNVVLPCPVSTFLAHSVSPFGGDWEQRFRYCIDRSESVTEVTNDATLMGNVAIELAAQIAMGLAIKTSDELATAPIQLLLEPRKGGLSDRFSEVWRSSRARYRSETLESIKVDEDDEHFSDRSRDREKNRVLAAILFADLSGYGSLSDAQVLEVSRSVLQPLRYSIEEVSSDHLYLNSWGDGIIAVYESVSIAAEVATKMHNEFLKIDLKKLGLPESLALRIGAHYGPLTLVEDPVTERPGVLGAQVSHAAKIEPLAVPGSALTSEAFAAALALLGNGKFVTRYVGRRELKGKSELERLFSLS